LFITDLSVIIINKLSKEHIFKAVQINWLK